MYVGGEGMHGVWLAPAPQERNTWRKDSHGESDVRMGTVEERRVKDQGGTQLLTKDDICQL